MRDSDACNWLLTHGVALKHPGFSWEVEEEAREWRESLPRHGILAYPGSRQRGRMLAEMCIGCNKYSCWATHRAEKKDQCPEHQAWLDEGAPEVGYQLPRSRTRSGVERRGQHSPARRFVEPDTVAPQNPWEGCRDTEYVDLRPPRVHRGDQWAVPRSPAQGGPSTPAPSRRVPVSGPEQSKPSIPVPTRRVPVNSSAGTGKGWRPTGSIPPGPPARGSGIQSGGAELSATGSRKGGPGKGAENAVSRDALEEGRKAFQDSIYLAQGTSMLTETVRSGNVPLGAVNPQRAGQVPNYEAEHLERWPDGRHVVLEERVRGGLEDRALMAAKIEAMRYLDNLRQGYKDCLCKIAGINLEGYLDYQLSIHQGYGKATAMRRRSQGYRDGPIPFARDLNRVDLPTEEMAQIMGVDRAPIPCAR